MLRYMLVTHSSTHPLTHSLTHLVFLIPLTGVMPCGQVPRHIILGG